jgi:aminoglycoside 3-N-acetyltransferase
MRSKNPLFSVATVGRHAKKFENSSFKTSFGKGSCFDVLHKLNGKIICLACNFDRITFTHYVEQKLKVNYRYLKKFLGQIVTNKKRRKITTDFYVRNLGIKSEIYLKSLKNLLLKEKQLKCSALGRFAVSSVRVRHFEQGIKKIINKNPYGLILEGSKN